MKKKFHFFFLALLFLFSSCGSKKGVISSRRSASYIYTMPDTRGLRPIRIERPVPNLQYTVIKIKTLNKYQRQTVSRMYKNPFKRTDGLTFKNWDEAYSDIMKEFEIKPEDSEKMKNFKLMNKELQNKLKESGLSEKEIKKFYVLNYLQAQESE